MKESKIEWTDHTLKKPMAALCLAKIADTIRLEVFKFVAVVAERDSVGNFKSKFGVCLVWLDVVRSQVSAFVASAFLTSVTIMRKHGVAPQLVFWRAARVHGSLKISMRKSIMGISAWCPLASNLCNSALGFLRVLASNSVGFPTLCRNAHFETGLFGHSFALHWRNECEPTNNPCSFKFITFSHPSTIH